MTIWNGGIDFNTKLKEVGGLKHISKKPLGKNLWYIMKEFNVLPTDERFQNLTNEQLGFIMYNMEDDANKIKRARKGYSSGSGSHYEDNDDSWYTDKDFEVLREGHDEEDIARQVDALTKEEDLDKIKGKMKSIDDWNKYLEEGGEDAKKVHQEKRLQENIDNVFEEARKIAETGKKPEDVEKIEKAKEGDFREVDDESLDEAIKLFNEDSDTGEDDDDDFI